MRLEYQATATEIEGRDPAEIMRAELAQPFALDEASAGTDPSWRPSRRPGGVTR